MGETKGRRGHNEGSIYQRKSDGRWVGSVNLGYGPDGKRKRRLIYGKTRKEVAEKIKAVLRDQQLGLPVAPGRQTFGQFLDGWIKDVVQPNLRPTTYRTYETHVRKHIKPALGRLALQQIEPQKIQSFLNYKLAGGLAPRTVADMHAVLHAALQQALRWGLVSRNVASLVDRPHVPRNEVSCLTPEQARVLVRCVRGDHFEGLFVVALSLGLRRGEALGLRWEDVDLERGVLTVRQAIQRVDGKLSAAELKTRASHRSINLPSVTIAALRQQRLRQIEDKLQAGAQWKETGFVFTSRVGTPVDPRNYKRVVDRALQRAGLPHMRIHDMRHTAASLLLAQGVPPKMISEILGHARVGITLDIYSHLYEPMRQEAAARMDDVLTREDAI